MIGLLLGLALAADPAVLRAPELEGVAFDSGGSLAFDRVAVIASGRSGSAVGLALGARVSITDPERPAYVALTAAGGGVVTTHSPGVALLGMGALTAGRAGQDWRYSLGLVTVPAFRVDRPQLAAPLFLEPSLGVRFGKLWLGGRGELGAVLQTGGPPAVRAALTGWLRFALPSWHVSERRQAQP